MNGGGDGGGRSQTSGAAATGPALSQRVAIGMVESLGRRSLTRHQRPVGWDIADQDQVNMGGPHVRSQQMPIAMPGEIYQRASDNRSRDRKSVV